MRNLASVLGDGTVVAHAPEEGIEQDIGGRDSHPIDLWCIAACSVVGIGLFEHCERISSVSLFTSHLLCRSARSSPYSAQIDNPTARVSSLPLPTIRAIIASRKPAIVGLRSAKTQMGEYRGSSQMDVRRHRWMSGVYCPRHSNVWKEWVYRSRMMLQFAEGGTGNVEKTNPSTRLEVK